MRKNLHFFICTVLIFLFLPMVCLFSHPPSPDPAPPAHEDDPVREPLPDRQTVRVVEGDTVRTLSITEYLTGVAAAECTPDAEPAALEALVIAARARLEYRIQNAAHADGDVCADGSHCDAIWTAQEAKQAWGSYWFGEYYPVLQQAVARAKDRRLTYRGGPALALTHELSAGNTETAAEFGLDLPYLVSAESPWDDTAKNYSVTKTLSREKLRETLLRVCPEADLSGETDRWLSEAVFSAAGGLVRLFVGGQALSGPALAQALNLPSAHISFRAEDGGMTFTALGVGHGFGMSRYGANEMAKRGSGAEEILLHYFPGCEIQ